MNNSAKRITVSLAGWQLYLLPGDLRRPNIDWLGTVQRGGSETKEEKRYIEARFDEFHRAE